MKKRPTHNSAYMRFWVDWVSEDQSESGREWFGTPAEAQANQKERRAQGQDAKWGGVGRKKGNEYKSFRST